MMYLAWVGATDPCKVVLLAHYDTDTSTNSAPYYLDVEPGGSAFSGYDISSSAKFGAGSLDVVEGAATEMSVWLNDDFDPLAIPFKGSATIEWRMRRPGGLQSTGLGTSETSFLNMELRFSDGDLLYFNFGYYGSAFSAQDQGAGLRVFTENGPASSGIYRETGFGWTDSNWHAIRVTVEGGDTVHLHVDGDYKTSVSIGPLAISGVTLDSVAFNGGKTFPTTTDELQIDELRVMINRALSDNTDYTPATGAWVDATCDSDTEPPPEATLLLHFEGADGETNIVDSSVHGWTMTGHDACKISTAQAKWGGSSLLVSRTSGMKGLAAISASAVLAHAIDEPWWVDFWVYPVAIASSQLHRVFRFIGGSGPNNSATLLKTGGQLYALMGWNIGDEGGPPYPPVISLNTWTHIAVCYDGTTQRRFVNGVIAASTVRSSLPTASSSGSVEIGGAVTSTGTTPDGSTEIYIDELRFILGSCPYTSDFTPPTGPY